MVKCKCTIVFIEVDKVIVLIFIFKIRHSIVFRNVFSERNFLQVKMILKGLGLLLGVLPEECLHLVDDVVL